MLLADGTCNDLVRRLPVLSIAVIGLLTTTEADLPLTCPFGSKCSSTANGRPLTEACREAIVESATVGDLHAARLGAIAVYRQHGSTSEASRACASVWKDTIDGLLLDDASFLDKVKNAHLAHAEHRQLPALERCWSTTQSAAQEWRECCSNAYSDMGLSSCFGQSGRSSFELCCALGDGSDSYLVVPALMEAWVHLLLPNRILLRIEQDGLLRAFDQSTVLWPAGYLLSQWIASAEQCSSWKGAKILELGAGVGAPSLAAATCGAQVLSTDSALRSLALVQANAGLNGEVLETKVFDWHDDVQLAEVQSHGPFTAIFGAALRFEDWWPRFWHVLGVLAGDSPETLVALSHTTDAIEVPPEFELVRRISGDAHGMGRPDRGADYAMSDFELVLLRASARKPS